jgi:hypothetical protein
MRLKFSTVESFSDSISGHRSVTLTSIFQKIKKSDAKMISTPTTDLKMTRAWWWRMIAFTIILCVAVGWRSGKSLPTEKKISLE